MKKVLAGIGFFMAMGGLLLIWDVASKPAMSHLGKWMGLAFAIAAVVAGARFVRIAGETD